MQPMTFAESFRTAHGIATRGRDLESDMRELIAHGSTPPNPPIILRTYKGETLSRVEYPASVTRLYRALRACGFWRARAKEFIRHARESKSHTSVTYAHTTPTPGCNYHLELN